MKYRLAQHTVAGSRPENQDRIASVERDNAVLMVLADGLGGHAGGGLAAETLVQTVVKSFQKFKQPMITNPPAFLALSILHAHKAINTYTKAAKQPPSARTTCVLCLLQNGYAYWAHVGDSRLYHFRDNQLLTRTLDHTTAEQLQQDGIIKIDDKSTNKLKSYLLKCVGGPQRPRITLSEETLLLPGDALLMCSDGVWQALGTAGLSGYLYYQSLDESIEEMLLGAENRMKEACDNLSVIALRWNDTATTHQPLQTGPASEIDQDILWQEAKRKALHRRIDRHRSKSSELKIDGARAHRNKKNSIQADIDEVEAFIRDLEKRS